MRTEYKIQYKDGNEWLDWYGGFGWEDKAKAEQNAKSVSKINGWECKVVPKELYRYRIDWYSESFDDDEHMGCDYREFETENDAWHWADWRSGGFLYDVKLDDEWSE